MVYRSSRRQASREREPESFTLQPDDSSVVMEKTTTLRRQVGTWRTLALIMIVLTIGLAIALVIIVTGKNSVDLPTCGQARARGNSKTGLIDLSEPPRPGPFHDLTSEEIRALRSFLEKDPQIKAVKAEHALINDSSIFMMDLAAPSKKDALAFLDRKGKQPTRQARVMMYRGDLAKPEVQEYICGPLPNVQSCRMASNPNRRNPVEWSLRPIGISEYMVIYEEVLPKVDKEIGYIMKESYGTSFSDCEPSQCFKLYPSPIATNLVEDIDKRWVWIWAEYPAEFYILHPTGLGILLDLSSSDPSEFKCIKVWYNEQLFESTAEFIAKYNSGQIEKVKMTPPDLNKVKDMTSSLHLRGDPIPETPQRPPTLVEPDGKRYNLKDRKVEYLGWTFNFRMSALTGPALYDIRYKNERIVYELSLAEIAVYYSANNPMHRVTDYADSGALLGSHSKALVPGADCPETATFINQTFSAATLSQATEIQRAFCLFENNNGYPLRRHLSYPTFEGAFYNGLQDSVLVLRSALTIVNYDYIIDFIFHQNGVVESRVMSTGYIFPSFYRSVERPYGFNIEKGILGNIHHHLFHYKVDLDVGGTSNRYETLNIERDEVQLRIDPKKKYYQTRFTPDLKKTEKKALYKYDFDTPKYHVVHNNASRTKYGEIKAYRIGLHGMSKQLLPEDKGSERTIAWARHQLAVTRHKDEELVSSSPYAMWDSYRPVTDFTSFYEDDEDIVDKDLVFWITEGMHHIPHTEDLPVTPTVGNHLTFFLFPYNYFDECPSVSSRDQVRIEHADPSDPTKGVKVSRYGNSDDQCILPQTATAYEKLLKEDPDTVLECRKDRGLF